MPDDVLAMCQAPDGPHDYVPHPSDTCFMDCPCKPRHYIAIDAVQEWAAGQDGPTIWALQQFLSDAMTKEEPRA